MGILFNGRRIPCTIGKAGVTKNKREGDGATPAGVHRIVGMLYRPDHVAQPQHWAMPIRNGDLWSDESADTAYNHLVRRPYSFSHEVLRRADRLYDIILVTDFNFPSAVPGGGSAIFLHQQRRQGYPTEGCVAFRRQDLIWIAQNVQFGARLIVPKTLSEHRF